LLIYETIISNYIYYMTTIGTSIQKKTFGIISIFFCQNNWYFFGDQKSINWDDNRQFNLLVVILKKLMTKIC
jgi:hypothetical protein